MLSIGQFSQASKLSIKTLRYYHELGILIPDEIDQTSGYRFYAEASLIRAEEIARWKAMGFSLSEIQELLPLQQLGRWEELKQRIQEKAETLEIKEQELRDKRERLLNWQPSPLKQGSLQGEVKLLEEGSLTYLNVPVKGPYHHIGRGFSTLFKEPSARIQGPPFSLYFKLGFEDSPEMLACAEGSINTLSSVIRSARLEAGRWVSQLYRGPYDGLGRAYQALFDYCSQAGLKAIAPAREIYLQGPECGDEEKFLTDVRMKVEA